MSTNSFMGHLLASYIDLSPPAPNGPLHTWRPHYSWQRCRLGGHVEEGNLQRILPPAFRESLQHELGAGRHLAVHHPDELEPALRTDEWCELIDLVDAFERLDMHRQSDVAAMLMSLGFFDLINRLVPMPAPEAVRSNRAAASLACTTAEARLVRALEGLEPYSLDELIIVGTWAPQGTMIRFDALLDLVVQCGKRLKDLDGARYWREQVAQELERLCVCSGRDSFTTHLLTSRFYRAASYVPFLAGDRDAVVAEMELCESHALSMRASSDKQHVIARENLLPMLQSRAKEARWVGDLQLARERLERACSVDPADSVRWIELGEVLLDLGQPRQAGRCYVKAAGYAPPGAALAWFMAGECERLCGNLVLACAWYQNAMVADPLCTSAARQLRSAARELGTRRDLESLAAEVERGQEAVWG